MTSIYRLSKEQLKEVLSGKNFKPFSASQIIEWLYHKNSKSFDEMTNLSLDLRNFLKDNYGISALKNTKRLISVKEPGTSKFLLSTIDQYPVEMVLMPNSKSKSTVCVSTQAGCNFRCSFCATGQSGFRRNLTFEEMISQITLASDAATISNIVFMGMGEPLVNPETFSVLERLLNKDYFELSGRGITVSTIGIPEGIIRMADYKQVKLAWSYHTGSPGLRAELFPVLNSIISLKDIISAFIRYQDLTKKRITIEYLLLKNINDSRAEAEKLMELSKKLFFHLNIIPYNAHPLSAYDTPERKSVQKFTDYFKESGIEVTIRNSKGSDIQGACGQLAGRDD